MPQYCNGARDPFTPDGLDGIHRAHYDAHRLWRLGPRAGGPPDPPSGHQEPQELDPGRPPIAL